MEDYGFVIGVPVWDRWIVWHMLMHRFKNQAKLTPGLLHLNHPLGWSETDLAKGMEIMRREYGIGQKGLSVAICDVTGRLQVKKGSRNSPTRSFSKPR